MGEPLREHRQNVLPRFRKIVRFFGLGSTVRFGLGSVTACVRDPSGWRTRTFAISRCRFLAMMNLHTNFSFAHIALVLFLNMWIQRSGTTIRHFRQVELEHLLLGRSHSRYEHSQDLSLYFL